MDAEPTVAAVFATCGAEGRTLGVAVLRPRARTHMRDTVTNALELYQFLETDRYTNIESLLVRSAVRHVYVADTLPAHEMRKLFAIEGVEAPGDTQPAALTMETVSKSRFNDSDILSTMARLTAGAVEPAAEERRLALRAAACVLGKADLATAQATVSASPDGSTASTAVLAVQLCDLDAYVRLDAAAVRALNIFSSPRDAMSAASSAAVDGVMGVPAGSTATASAPSVTSLHALVSMGCKTKGGKRLLRTWLLQPLVDAAAVHARQQLVRMFVVNTTLRRSWRDGSNMPDLEALAARLNRKTATLQDLLRLYHFAVLLPKLVERLSSQNMDATDRDALRAAFVERLNGSASEFGKYMELVEKVVEDVGSPEPRIAPSWDPELDALAQEREELESGIHDVWSQARAPGGWASSLGVELKCERDKVRGYVFRVPAKVEKAVRAIPSVHIAAVLKDGLYFTTGGSNGLKRLGDRLLEVEAEYEAKSRAVFASALDVARSYTPLLESTAAIIAELDAICSLAHLASTAPGQYVLPEVTPAGTGDIIVREGRHPVMEFLDGTRFVPNDYEMNRDSSRFVIITGPNMGGKSTYIRTLGCICLLAQIGSYVPASSATVSACDMICARIGAGDKATKGVSTFMAEMTEAAAILHAATPRSLVIIDELGRGTSTYDGFGLAWAISEHLATTTRCFTLFATHFHELTDLSTTVPCVRNRHVSAHTSAGSITMLYNVREGACPTSFGIHVAELAGFPKSVIEEAKLKASQLEATAGHAGQILRAGLQAAATGHSHAQPTELTALPEHAAKRLVANLRDAAPDLLKMTADERLSALRRMAATALPQAVA